MKQATSTQRAGTAILTRTTVSPIRTVAIPLLFLVLTSTITLFVNYEAFIEQTGLYVLLNILTAYTVLIISSEYRQQELFSPLALLSASIAAHFGISGLMYPDVYIFVNNENYRYIVYAAAYVLAFLAMFHYTYRALQSTSTRATTILSWRSSRVATVVVILLVIGWLARGLIIYWNVYLQTSLGTEDGARRIQFLGTVRQLEIFPNYAGYILLIHYQAYKQTGRIKANAIFKYAAAIIILINLVYWLPTGKKFPIISSAIIPIIINYLYTKRLPRVRYTAAFCVFVLALFPITHMYRVSQAQLIGGQNVDSFDALIRTIQEAALLAPDANSIGAGGRTFGRLNQLEPVAGSIRVIEANIMDKRYGSDYYNTFVNMIPSAIWPDKPLVMYGNDFGRSIGMLRATDPFTSISVTLIGEAYLNFESVGIFVGALLALIYWSTYRADKIGLNRETTVLIYCGAIPTILYIGASFALYVSSLLQTCVLLYLISMPLTNTRQGRLRLTLSANN